MDPTLRILMLRGTYEGPPRVVGGMPKWLSDM